ncbi:DoxX family protein [Fictibacillus fluitans]|uniref:DoxX family protein n=1 Tax=Fictibacillus fluitans TaxID=3058422 RepID=A0ABT8HUW5_9BACL|nr:DoxX family protein [Fictibacillus sp. NE201]MDN4524524.1 DoxX family protein [Fictibacillus sp. NE201]
MRGKDAGAFILRIFIGVAFLIHGSLKFQGGIGNTAGWFDSIGLPGFLAYIVAVIELAGGVLLILGLGTRVVAFLFAVILLGAVFTVKAQAGFTGNGQSAGYELDLAYLVISVFLLLNGSCLLSLDVMLQKNKTVHYQ